LSFIINRIKELLYTFIDIQNVIFSFFFPQIFVFVYFQVSSLSNTNFTRCLCNHLTSFGVDFFVPPNEIDFQTVFNNLDQKIKDNWAVLSTLCGFLFLYFLGLIWTRHQDKKDIIKVIFIFLFFHFFFIFHFYRQYRQVQFIYTKKHYTHYVGIFYPIWIYIFMYWINTYGNLLIICVWCHLRTLLILCICCYHLESLYLACQALMRIPF
jgi:hypothetical protein